MSETIKFEINYVSNEWGDNPIKGTINDLGEVISARDLLAKMIDAIKGEASLYSADILINNNAVIFYLESEEGEEQLVLETESLYFIMYSNGHVIFKAYYADGYCETEVIPELSLKVEVL